MSTEFDPNLIPLLPQWEICRARDLGIEGFAECQVLRPWRCPYVVDFGSGHFCHHPRQAEIIAKTLHAAGKPHKGFNQTQAL